MSRECTNTWEGLYGESWKDVAVAASMGHPAKYSRALIRRIYQHAVAEGWLSAGSVVVDPFGGVALGALDAMVHGCTYIGVELEPKFHTIGNANIALWNRRWGHTAGWGKAVLLQGDSRNLCAVVGQQAAALVASPPYAGLGMQERSPTVEKPPRPGDVRQYRRKAPIREYGSAEGQLGAMKEGSHADAVLGSPPYAGMAVEKNSRSVDLRKQYETYRAASGGASFEKFCATQERHSGGYGSSPGQLAALPEGAADSVVSSPPYEGMEGHASMGHPEKHCRGGPLMNHCTTGARPGAEKMAATSGNIASESGETFWSAARVIVDQCHQILRPGGVAIWVVKAFVRDGKLVDFPARWKSLCESVGFRFLHEHRAMLVKAWTEPDLFAGTVKKEKRRESFFRRLARKKGSPGIDWECVLCLEKEA